MVDEIDVFVIGGVQIYKAFYKYAHRLHITIVDEKITGIDAYFPIPLAEIEKSFTLIKSKSLADNAQYTYWTKIT